MIQKKKIMRNISNIIWKKEKEKKRKCDACVPYWVPSSTHWPTANSTGLAPSQRRGRVLLLLSTPLCSGIRWYLRASISRSLHSEWWRTSSSVSTLLIRKSRLSSGSRTHFISYWSERQRERERHAATEVCDSRGNLRGDDSNPGHVLPASIDIVFHPAQHGSVHLLLRRDIEVVAGDQIQDLVSQTDVREKDVSHVTIIEEVGPPQPHATRL